MGQTSGKRYVRDSPLLLRAVAPLVCIDTAERNALSCTVNIREGYNRQGQFEYEVIICVKRCAGEMLVVFEVVPYKIVIRQ